jgi:hypothetical protein
MRRPPGTGERVWWSQRRRAWGRIALGAMSGSHKRKRMTVIFGLRGLLTAFLLVATVVWSSEGGLPVGFPRFADQQMSFYTHKGPIMPVDELVKDPRSFVAIVEPLERGVIYTVPLEQRSEFGVDVGDEDCQGNWAFTPANVRIAESLKGQLPPAIVVWEERGRVPGCIVDSSEPYLRPGEKGLLIFGKHLDGWFPILFAAIDDDGRIPSLDTTIEEVRELCTQS